jgi:hypothetical protein
MFRFRKRLYAGVDYDNRGRGVETKTSQACPPNS